MFCTKCGKELYPGDRFCAYCGAEVRNHEKPRYEDIVFNPPFKIEAEKKTQEILQAVAQPQEAPTPKQTASVAFDWELEDTPRRKSQETWTLTGRAFWSAGICPAHRRSISKRSEPHSLRLRAGSALRRVRTKSLHRQSLRRRQRRIGLRRLRQRRTDLCGTRN